MNLPMLEKLTGRLRRSAGSLSVCTSTRGAYVCEVALGGEKPLVKQCRFFPLMEVTAAALDKLRRENDVGKHQFATLLSPGEYQIVMVDAPNVPAEELKTAMRWRMKDVIDYPVEEAVVDVLSIPSVRYGSEHQQSVYAVAARHEVIRKRIQMFENAAMPLSVIDIPEAAQRNVATLFEQEGRALALLAFDHNGGLLTFSSGGELFLARRMEVTVGQLQDASESARARHLERVELELQRSMDYFDRQYSHLPVSRILVAAPEEIGLEQFLLSSTGLPVQALDLAQGLDISLVPELADRSFAAHLLPALGLALRQEGRRA
jgi:MSHA biogenesis protein MshI